MFFIHQHADIFDSTNYLYLTFQESTEMRSTCKQWKFEGGVDPQNAMTRKSFVFSFSLHLLIVCGGIRCVQLNSNVETIIMADWFYLRFNKICAIQVGCGRTKEIDSFDLSHWINYCVSVTSMTASTNVHRRQLSYDWFQLSFDHACERTPCINNYYCWKSETMRVCSTKKRNIMGDCVTCGHYPANDFHELCDG